MARLKAIPQASFRRSRWKNGGGETTEIAAFPDGAGLDAFVWRISMAKVAASGPFSMFPGIDRTLCVVEGDAIGLAFEARSLVRLGLASPPYSFAADIAVSGTIAGAGITDLNVMSRRGVARHHVSRVRIEAPISVTPLGKSLLVLSLEAALTIRSGPDTLHLAAGDAALSSAGAALDLECDHPAEIFLIDLWH